MNRRPVPLTNTIDLRTIFMKLQPASKKEVKRMAIGSVICLAIELAVFLVLHFINVLAFSCRTVISAMGGVIVELISFVILCLSVQQAAGMTDKKAMKARMQLSYNLRLLLQAGWVVAAFAAPFLSVLAAAVPLLFPTAIIFFLQKKGTLVSPSDRKNPESSPEDDEEDHLESFEV